MKHSMVSLGSVAEFINGVAFKPSDWGEEGKKIVRIQNLTDPEKPFNRTTREVESKYVIHPGDLLVSWSATLGVFTWDDEETAIVNQHIFRVEPDEDVVDRSYLRHMLADALLDMERHLHGATMKHVNRSEFLSTQIPLPHKNGKPDLNEQKRIAALLDKADALRRKRQEALRLTDDFLRSTFLDLFGDPEKHGWPMETVEDMLSARPNAIRTGPFGSQLLHSEFVDSGIAVLGIDNAVQNEFRWGKPRFISEEKYEQLRRYTVHPGDVIITIMGTVGRCAIVPADIPTAINTKHLCCLTLDRSKCLPEFLHTYFLTHPIARRYLGQSAKGAIMDGLNMGLIKALPVPKVPLQLQQRFSDIAKQVQKTALHSAKACQETETLFSALQQRAFIGQL
jgi:type I restriction enzyme, S subunit